MKQCQKMQSRSLYMPESIWKEIDETAEKEDLSANQVIRKVLSSWLLGFLVEKDEDKRRARRKELHYGR